MDKMFRRRGLWQKGTLLRFSGEEEGGRGSIVQMFRRGRHGDYGEKGDISLLFSRGRLGDYGGGVGHS